MRSYIVFRKIKLAVKGERINRHHRIRVKSRLPGMSISQRRAQKINFIAFKNFIEREVALYPVRTANRVAVKSADNFPISDSILCNRCKFDNSLRRHLRGKTEIILFVFFKIFLLAKPEKFLLSPFTVSSVILKRKPFLRVSSCNLITDNIIGISAVFDIINQPYQLIFNFLRP